MRKTTLNFSQNARRVYTATKKAIERCGQFKRIECNDQTITIMARRFPLARISQFMSLP